MRQNGKFNTKLKTVGSCNITKYKVSTYQRYAETPSKLLHLFWVAVKVSMKINQMFHT